MLFSDVGVEPTPPPFQLTDRSCVETIAQAHFIRDLRIEAELELRRVAVLKRLPAAFVPAITALFADFAARMDHP
jgi:hypothetical protein